MMRIRAIPFSGQVDGAMGESSLALDAAPEDVRGAVGRAIQSFRERERELGEGPGPVTLEILPREAERWVPVHVDAGSPPPYTRLRIDSPFEVDWRDLTGLIHLTHRYWVSRMRLLERARGQRSEGD